jgi:hypothetical protein
VLAIASNSPAAKNLQVQSPIAELHHGAFAFVDAHQMSCSDPLM